MSVQMQKCNLYGRDLYGRNYYWFHFMSLGAECSNNLIRMERHKMMWESFNHMRKAYTITYICLVQVRLRAKVLRTPISTRPWFELITSRSWQYISRHWDACSNQLAISDLNKINVLPHYLRGLRWFQMHGLSDRLMTGDWYFTFILTGNSQRLQKLTYLHLFTDCFMNISLQYSEEI